MSDVVGNGAVWMGLQLLVKASMLVGAALVVQWLIGARSSAAARHLSWSIVVIGLLGLPLLSAVLPTWEVALPVSRSLSVAPANGDVGPSPGAPDSIVRSSAVDSPSASAAPAPDAPSVQEKPSMSWPTALVVLYAWGALVLLTYLAAEQLSVRRLAMQATEIVDDGWRQMLDECRRSLRIEHPVRLLRSRQHTMPMVFGLRSPAILLPAIADTWDDDRRRAVVLHELAHVSRRDCLTQTLGAIACAAYWPHPGVWWIARRLRIERELACDDLVLTAGTSARDYAGHLLELAHTLGGGRAPALVVTMARPRQLEGRMLAVMDSGRSRVVPGIRTRLASVAVAAAFLVPLASADAVLVNATAALPPDTNVAVPPDASAVAHPSTESARQASPSPYVKKRTSSFESRGRFGRDSAIDLPWHLGDPAESENRHGSPSIDGRRLELGILNSSRPARGHLVRPARGRQRARQVQHPARRRDVRLRGHGEGWCRRRRVLLQPQHGIRPGARETGLWPADRRRTVLACAR